MEGTLGEGLNFVGLGAIAEEMVEEEVVQLVGANDFFGLLGEGIFVVHGEQFGGDGGIDDRL